MTHFEITMGPSQEELFDALRLRHENRKVRFTVRNDQGVARATITIDSIGIEDGSGNNWLFSGRGVSGRLLKGYINTRTRKGWLEYVK